MGYATFEFYKNSYNGANDITTFNRLNLIISTYIDSITFSRAQNYVDDKNLLALTACTLIDVLNLSFERQGIASESNDGISVSYDSSETGVFGANAYKIASTFLSGTGLLYRGVARRCKN